MFEKFLYSNMGPPKASYSQLLQRPETKLVQVLDEDSFVSDFKSGSQRVKDFMTYQRFVELTDLVTVVGPESDKKRSYKFPITACEMLCSDNTRIDQIFLPFFGVVNVEEKVTKRVEKLVEVEVDDDDDDQTQEKQQEVKSSQNGSTSPQKQKQNQAKEQAEKTGTEAQQFGEFVQAPAKTPKPKKKVMVKQIVETTEIVKRQHPPLLLRIWQYFAGEMNHTLTAYVCKVMLSFVNKKSTFLLPRLFESTATLNKVFDLIFSHIGSRSTVELVTRIISMQNRNYISPRFEMTKKLVRYMHKAEGIESLSNIAACVCQSYEKIPVHLKTATPIKDLQIFMQKIPELLKILVQIVLSDREEAATYGAQIFGNLLALFPIKDQLHLLPELQSHYLPGTIAKLQAILSLQRPKLGMFALKVVQTYNSSLRATGVHQFFKGSGSNVFPILFGLIEKYAFNNIFHNEAFKFVQNCLASSLPELSEAVVGQSGLLQWLEEEASSETDRIKGPKRGYSEHIVNLCKFMKEQAKKNAILQKFTSSASFESVWSALVDRQVVSSEKPLGGYAKKEIQQKVMYNKQSILAAHATFLASAPAATLQKDMNDPLQNQQLLQEIQRQLDGEDLPVEPKPAQVVLEQQHKAQLIEENEQHKAAFWKVHLDYDIDNLIDELQ